MLKEAEFDEEEAEFYFNKLEELVPSNYLSDINNTKITAE